MSSSIVGSYIIKGNKLLKARNEAIPSNVGVYEVLRVIDGVPLFWDDHYLRLLNSLSLAGWSLQVEQASFAERMKTLIHSNNRLMGNIKIEVFRQDTDYDIFFYFIPHNYPDEFSYVNGVDVGLLEAERSNPKAKIHQFGLREEADQLIQEKGFFEVLLVNKEKQLTEGSRSNFFFMKNSSIYTAPEEFVLSGITRQKVIECIHEMGCELVEMAIDVTELSTVDAVFLTGTSPKILPICKINSMSYRVDFPKMRELMSRYDKKIENYIAQNKVDFIS